MENHESTAGHALRHNVLDSTGMTTKVNTKRAMYGISRIDDKRFRTHAWRVNLRRRGTQYVRNFADQIHGGKAKALQAAKQYRDRFLRRYPPLTRREFSNVLRSHNQSRVTGVYRFASRYRLKGGEWRSSWYWEAHWPTKPGEHESARFSINRLSEREAFATACVARARGLKRVEGIFWRCDW